MEVLLGDGLFVINILEVLRLLLLFPAIIYS